MAKSKYLTSLSFNLFEDCFLKLFGFLASITEFYLNFLSISLIVPLKVCCCFSRGKIIHSSNIYVVMVEMQGSNLMLPGQYQRLQLSSIHMDDCQISICSPVLCQAIQNCVQPTTCHSHFITPQVKLKIFSSNPFLCLLFLG